MSVKSVTRENFAGWNWRVPRLLIALGMPITLVIAVVSLPAETDTPTIQEAISWFDFFGNSLVGVAMLAAVAAWRLPRVSLWVCSSLALITASVSGETSVQIFGAAWLVVAAADAASLRRQKRLSQDWRIANPGRGPLPLQHLADKSLRGSVIGTILIVIAVGAFGWYVHEREELRELDDRAVTATATVTGQDAFFDAVTMKVSGKKHDFFVGDVTDYPIGSKQEVFVDPTGEHRPYNYEDVDPNGAMGGLPAIPAALLALAAASLILPRRRIAQLRDLADRGGDPVRAVVAADPHSGGLLIYPVGHTSLRHPIALIPRPVPVWGSGFAIPAPEVMRMAGPSMGNPLDVWVLNPWDRSIFASPTEVLINGLRSDGSHVLVEHIDSQGTPHMWAASGPVRDPNTIRRLFARLTGRLAR